MNVDVLSFLNQKSVLGVRYFSDIEATTPTPSPPDILQ
jgi:hypothetical protein